MVLLIASRARRLQLAPHKAASRFASWQHDYSRCDISYAQSRCCWGRSSQPPWEMAPDKPCHRATQHRASPRPLWANTNTFPKASPRWCWATTTSCGPARSRKPTRPSVSCSRTPCASKTCLRCVAELGHMPDAMRAWMPNTRTTLAVAVVRRAWAGSLSEGRAAERGTRRTIPRPRPVAAQVGEYEIDVPPLEGSSAEAISVWWAEELRECARRCTATEGCAVFEASRSASASAWAVCAFFTECEPTNGIRLRASAGPPNSANTHAFASLGAAALGRRARVYS